MSQCLLALGGGGGFEQKEQRFETMSIADQATCTGIDTAGQSSKISSACTLVCLTFCHVNHTRTCRKSGKTYTSYENMLRQSLGRGENVHEGG